MGHGGLGLYDPQKFAGWVTVHLLHLTVLIIMTVKKTEFNSGGSRKKIFGGPGPSAFGRQQRLSDITTEPIKNLGGLGKIWGKAVPPGPDLEPPLEFNNIFLKVDGLYYFYSMSV